MSSNPAKNKMDEPSITENPLGNELFEKCTGLPNSQRQQSERNETKRDILPVLTPLTRLNVRKYTTSEKLWAGVFYRFYIKYNSFKVFTQDDANTGVNIVSSYGKNTKHRLYNDNKKNSLKTSNASNVIAYTLSLQKLGVFLSGYNLNHNNVQVQPRGLVNRSTRCYVNATLQALLMCPPFYNLMESMRLNITDITNSQKKLISRIPIVESIVKFIGEFEENTPVANPQSKTPNPKVGPAFDPHFVYKILPTFEDGYQEDAEEFMSHLFNCITDEMTDVIQLSKPDQDENPPEIQLKVSASNLKRIDTARRRRKINTRITVVEKTPLSKIFRGNMRTRTVINNNELTDDIEPFFTLKLDIENAKSVDEAMHMFNAKTKLEGLTSSTDNPIVDAYQQLTIEELPYVLILHIKCFEYKEKKLTKILKNFEFNVDLKIEHKLLSKKTKKNMKRSNYKLFAVVCHDGKEATNGHYYADVFYADLGRWLRFDDSTVRCVKDAEVFQPKHLTMPYLLYYIVTNPDKASSATGCPTGP